MRTINLSAEDIVELLLTGKPISQENISFSCNSSFLSIMNLLYDRMQKKNNSRKSVQINF
jgi:hypothetical protein